MFPEDNKHRLTIQYRMHPTIGTLISHVFYNDEIQNGVEAQDRELCIEGYEGIAIEWISTSKYSTKERYEKEFDNNGKKSYQNYLERNIIERKLLELDSKLVKRTKVAVITGYGSQKYILQTMVKQHSFKHIEVDVDTVDAFQGSQKDIILYSTVRSSGNKYGIGFLKSEARINVAFSRARCLLIIVGDEKLYYVKDELFIYKNDDSEDYEFIIKGDIGERYQNSFYHQVRDVVYSGMENFFERDWDFSKNHYDKGLVTQEDRQYTKSLIEKLNGSEIISDELVDQYIHTRALIDEKELEAIFSCNQEFDYQGIVISCERLKKLLNPEIVSALNAISKKRIWLLYDPKEYNVNKILEQNFGDKIKKKEVSVSENERISEQFICFYPNILVEYVEKTEKVFDRPITIFEGRIEFDSDVIKNKIDKIIDEYEISFSLSEPEPEKMGKNKYNKHTKKGIAHTYKKYKYKEKNK